MRWLIRDAQTRSGRRSTWEGSSTQGGMRWLIRDAQYGALRTALHLGRIVNPGWQRGPSDDPMQALAMP